MGVGNTVLVTGATGFIGHYVLAELLKRGRCCLALVRGGAADEARLKQLLRACAPDVAVNAQNLRVVDGQLPDRLPEVRDEPVASVVHVAGNTSFRAKGPEPHRTNTEGMRCVLNWMDARGIADLTFVSTAFVSGARRDRICERFEPVPPRFHNEYEDSKWRAERAASNWASAPGRRLVIARPAIVAGDAHGRASEFRGFYLLARAIEQLSRSLQDRGRRERHSIPLRLPGHVHGASQLVPADYVGRAVAHLALDPSASGVYHLTHPQPATNGELKSWFEAIFDIGGGQFVGDAPIPASERSRYEEAFHWGLQDLMVYFADAADFDCSRALAALLPAGIECPPLDLPYLRRCIEFAQGRRWGRESTQPTASGDDEGLRLVAAYFERFLPERLPKSVVGRMHPVRAVVRFVIGQGQWVCRFEGGRLAQVRQGSNGLAEQFGYRTTTDGFFRAIAGQIDGERLFLSGQADVFGDMESALKLSAILGEFTREFPCDRERLRPYLEDA